MATTLSEVSIKGLRKAHFTQLFSYIAEREREMWHFGNRKQFEKRHDELVKWVEGIIEVVNDKNNIIPDK